MLVDVGASRAYTLGRGTAGPPHAPNTAPPRCAFQGCGGAGQPCCVDAYAMGWSRSFNEDLFCPGPTTQANVSATLRPAGMYATEAAAPRAGGAAQAERLICSAHTVNPDPLPLGLGDGNTTGGAGASGGGRGMASPEALGTCLPFPAEQCGQELGPCWGEPSSPATAVTDADPMCPKLAGSESDVLCPPG